LWNTRENTPAGESIRDNFPAMKQVALAGILQFQKVRGESSANKILQLDQSWFNRPSGSEAYVSCVNVSSPKGLKTPDAPYDPELRRQHVEGSAWLDVEVGADGKTHHPRVVHSDNPGFASAAYNAIRTWRFKPAMCGDLPVPMVVHIRMDFHLYH
jgi:TonB family protein